MQILIHASMLLLRLIPALLGLAFGLYVGLKFKKFRNNRKSTEIQSLFSGKDTNSN